MSTWASNCKFSITFICLMLLSALSYAAGAEELDAKQLTDLDIEQLAQVKVTSAGKREQSLNDVSSAIFVISKEDIRRSTATSIPELLRVVPGLYVAQVNAHIWNISCRGLGGVFSNKLLILMDGRTLYTPLYSGTYWDVQDYPLGDIERIEVIRGPGGTLWGSNAVTGVINIITKSAKDTQGAAASVSAGTEVNTIANARYGFQADTLSARAYGRGRVVDDTERRVGGAGDDGYTSGQGGFKVEDKVSSSTSVTVQGDIYSINGAERIESPSPLPPFRAELGRQYKAKGGNLIAKVESSGFDVVDKTKIQFYYDRAERDELAARTAVNTFDVDGQYELRQLDRHNIVFGGGARIISDSTGDTRLVTVNPRDRSYTLVNGFAQDEVTLISEKLSLLGGVKFEHNEFTGPVWQPSVRATWHADPDLTLWGAVSRAVRIPARVSNDVTAPISVVPPSEEVPLPTLIQLAGSRTAKPEVVISYDVGVRTRMTRTVALDSTAFFADYSDLQTFDRGQPSVSTFSGVPVVLQPLDFASNAKSHIYGFENLVEWSPTTETRVQLWHSMQVVRTQLVNRSNDPFIKAEEQNLPVTQLGARGQFDLPADFEFNPFIRFVDSVPSGNAGAYWDAQLQLAWRATDKLRLALNVNQAVRDQHFEYRADFLGRPETNIERSVFITIAYQY